MGGTTVLITLHGSKHQVLGASARRPILVYQAATSEEELLRISLPRTPVNRGASTQTLSCLWWKGLEPAASSKSNREEGGSNQCRCT
jgi:hypothetical protein